MVDVVSLVIGLFGGDIWLWIQFGGVIFGSTGLYI